MLIWKEPVDLLLKIVRRRSGTESHSRNILLVMLLQLLRELGGLAYAHQKHTCSQRVQRPCMSHLQILLPEMTDSGELDLPDHVRRSPSVWFVYGDDYPLRIVGDIS